MISGKEKREKLRINNDKHVLVPLWEKKRSSTQKEKTKSVPPGTQATKEKKKKRKKTKGITAQVGPALISKKRGNPNPG